jgi:hypothetical protein
MYFEYYGTFLRYFQPLGFAKSQSGCHFPTCKHNERKISFAEKKRRGGNFSLTCDVFVAVLEDWCHVTQTRRCLLRMTIFISNNLN